MLNKYAILRFGVCAFMGFLILGCDRLSVDYDRIALECGGSVDRNHEYFAVKNAQGQTIGMSSDTTKVYKKNQAYANAAFSPNGCVHVPRNELPLRLKNRSELISLDLDSKEPGQMHYLQAERFDGQFKIQETCPGNEINGGLAYDIEPAVWIPEAKLKLQVLDADVQVRAELPMDASALAGQFNLSRQRLKAETGELSEGDYGIQLQIESDLWEKKVYPTLCRLAIDHTPPKLGPIKLGEFLKAGSQELVPRAAEENVRLFYQITEHAEEHSCQAAISQSLAAASDAILIPMKPGKYFYSIWAVDKALNCSSAQTGSFIVDDQAPPMPELIFKNKKTLAGGGEAEVVGAGAILELSSSEKNVSFRHCWQKVDDLVPCVMEPASGSLIKVPAEGHYQLHISSRDAAGWESATTIVDVLVDEGRPNMRLRWNVADMNESYKFIHLPYAKIEGQLTIQENFEETAAAIEAHCSVGFRNKSMSFSRDGVSCQLVDKSCAPLVTCPPGTRNMKVEIDLQSLFNQETQKSEWSQLDKGKMNIKVDVVDAAGNRATLSHEVRIELFPWVPVWALTDHRIQGLIDGSWPLMAMRDSYVVDKADWVWVVTNLGVLAVTRNDIKTFIDHRFFNQKVDIVSAQYSVMQDPENDRVWVLFKNKNRLGLAVHDRQQGGWSKLFDNKDVSGMDAFMTLVGKRGDSLFIEVGSNSTRKVHEFDLKQLDFVNAGEERDGTWAWNGLFVKDGRIFQANAAGSLEIQSDLPPLKQLWNQGEDLYLQSTSNRLFKASFEGGAIEIKDEWIPQPALGERDWVHHVNSDKSFWSMSFDNFPALALNYDNTASLFSPYGITNRRNGEQWFSDFDLGVLEFSPVVITSEIHTPKDCASLSNSQFVVTDEQALVFVCDKQLLQIDSHSTEQKVHSQVPLDFIGNLSMTKDGSLLASNPNGVVRYDAKSRTWKDLSKNETWYDGISGNMHDGLYSLVEHGRFLGRKEYRLAVFDEATLELKHDPIVGVEIEDLFSLSKPKIVLPINDHEAYFFHEFKGSYFLRKIRHENSSWIVTKTWELDYAFTYSVMNAGDRVFLIQYSDYKIHSVLVLDQEVLKVIPDSERLKGYFQMRLLKSLRRNMVYALSSYSTEAGIYELTPEGVKRIGLNEDFRAYFNSTFIDSKKRIWGLGASTQYIAERP